MGTFLASPHNVPLEICVNGKCFIEIHVLKYYCLLKIIIINR